MLTTTSHLAAILPARSLFLAALLMIPAAGCASGVCDRSCEAEGALYDACLPELGSSWEDMNYPDGVSQYVLACMDRWDASIEQARRRDDTTPAEVQAACSAREASALESTCTDL